MSRLGERLYQHYAEHYARVNRNVDPRQMSARQLRSLDRTYRHLIAGIHSRHRVLDVGCGTGHLLLWLSQHPNLIPVGVDLSKQHLSIAHDALGDVELRCEDGLQYLRRHSDAFAGIFCFDVLEHVADDDVLLDWIEAALGALRPGGFLCCRCPNAANLLGGYSRYMDLTHQRAFTRTSLIQLLEAGGFKDCRVVPIRAGALIPGIRTTLESWMHSVLFILSGRRIESVVTSNVCVSGLKV